MNNIERDLSIFINNMNESTTNEEIRKELKRLIELYKKKHTLFECPICMDEHPEEEMYTTQPCGHKFCHVCLLDHINSKINDTNGDISCPETGCTTLLNKDSLYASGLIDGVTFMKWKNLIILRRLQVILRNVLTVKQSFNLRNLVRKTLKKVLNNKQIKTLL